MSANIKNSILVRVRIAFIGVALFTLLIIAKIVSIQYFSEADWGEKARTTDVRLKTIKATRGNIYGDDGSLFATSLPFYYVAFDPTVSQRSTERKAHFDANLNALCDSLAMFFGDRSAEAYRRRIVSAIRDKDQYLRLNSHTVNYREKKRMANWPIFDQGRMKGGVIFEKDERRFKPFSHLASRTIGYTKLEQKPNGDYRRIGAGLEKSFDTLLAGRDGQGWFENIGSGKWKPIHNEEEIKPVHGLDVHTTIDINLQDVAHEALLEGIIKHNADHGCVVVMEVKTGKIKAMANIDKITNTNKVTGDEIVTYKELTNYAVARRDEPGSTIKLASMMAILEERDNLKLEDTVHIGTKGTYRFHDRICRDAHRTPSGYLSLEEIIAESSNIGVAKLAYDIFYEDKVSQQRFIDYLDRFGLVKPLHFQLIGEAKPKVKSPSDPSWSGISIPWMSHGYGLQLSPLQLLSFYNGVANDGRMIQPILVERVAYADKTIREFKPNIINEKLCSDETLIKVQTMLESVVEYGTAKNIRSKNYRIAGKTGTAKRLIDGRYTNTYYTSFVGYFPADNPKYSMIVVIDNPQQGGIYGSQVSAPVFKVIADKVYARDLEMQEPIKREFEREEGVFPVVQSGNLNDMRYLSKELKLNVWDGGQVQDEYVQALRDDEFKAIKWKPRVIVKDEVPDVTGMTLRDALPLLENAGLRVEVNGIMGRVSNQSHRPGSQLIVGSTIKLELS